MSDILERWPILDLYELLTKRSARFQEVNGVVKEIKSRNGKRFLKCPNPAHPDRRPSCRFNEKTDHWKCFSLGCEGNGRKIDLIKVALGLSPTASNAEAIAELKGRDPSWDAIREHLEHQPAPDPRFRDGEWIRLDDERLFGTYSYYGLDGQLCYQVLRYHGIDPETKKPSKRFAQRRPLSAGQWVRDKDRYVYVDVAGEPLLIPDGTQRLVSVTAVRRDGTERAPNTPWFWNLDGIERIPYRVRELRAGCELHRVAIVTEGEPHADALRALGFTATTNSEGTSFAYPTSWREYFNGAHAVLILSDCDESGRYAARMRARALHGAAPIVAPLDLWPERNDKYDAWNFIKDDLDGRTPRAKAIAVRHLLYAALEREGLREQLVA